MNSFKSFPPADDFLAILRQIDWKLVANVTLEGVDYFLEIVEQLVMLISAFCVVCYQKWQQHSMTSKTVQFSKVAYAWMIQVALPWIITTSLWLRDVAYPEARKMTVNVYTFTKATWETVSDIYSLVTARQFVSL